MFRTVGLSLLCLAMFSIAGGHWAVLQSIAWAQMLRDYSRDATFVVAVEKTFSGRSPCSLCEKVEAGRQKEERAPATAKVDKKIEIFRWTTGVAPRLRSGVFSYPPSVDLASRPRAEAPPFLPPKSALS